MTTTQTEPIQPEASDAQGGLASLLRATMRERGWSASKMANYLDTDRRTLFQWLAGREPSKALCTALRRSLMAGPMAEVYLHIQAALEAAQAAQRGRGVSLAPPDGLAARLKAGRKGKG